MVRNCYNCGSKDHHIQDCRLKRCLRCFEEFSYPHHCSESDWSKKFFGNPQKYRCHALMAIKKHGEDAAYKILKAEKERWLRAMKSVERAMEEFERDQAIFSKDVEENFFTDENFSNEVDHDFDNSDRSYSNGDDIPDLSNAKFSTEAQEEEEEVNTKRKK